MTRKPIHLTVDSTTIHILGRISKEYDLEGLGRAADFIIRQWEKQRCIEPSDEWVDKVAVRVVELIKGDEK
jgi:hypothetical protein